MKACNTIEKLKDKRNGKRTVITVTLPKINSLINVSTAFSNSRHEPPILYVTLISG